MLVCVPSLSKLPSSCTSWGTPCGWCCAVNLITRTSLSCLCTGCPAPFTQNKPVPFVRDAASVCLQFRGWRCGHAGGTGFWTTINKDTVRIPPAIWIYADVFLCFFSVGAGLAIQRRSVHGLQRLVNTYRILSVVYFTVRNEGLLVQCF